jgi:hypothetical protein
MNCLKEFITDMDIFAHDPSKELHYDGRHGHKRFFGGVCTCIMISIFFGVIIYSAIPIIKNKYPYEYNSNTIEKEPYEVKYADSYKIFVELTDYVKSYNYTDVERKMIDIYVNDYVV